MKQPLGRRFTGGRRKTAQKGTGTHADKFRQRIDAVRSGKVFKQVIKERAKPVAELLARRPQAASVLQAAMAETGLPVQQLRYLPLTSSKTKDWVALLNTEGRIVGYAPVDGF